MLQEEAKSGYRSDMCTSMLKSLNNFISVKEFWETQDSLLAGDDFRLWCLGLSGQYRSSATFFVSEYAGGEDKFCLCFIPAV